MADSAALPHSGLKSLLAQRDPAFWTELGGLTQRVNCFDELIPLSTLRRRAGKAGLPRPFGNGRDIRVALLGGYSTYPFQDMLEHFLECDGFAPAVWVGNFDNYHAEIRDQQSGLFASKPEVVVLFPSFRRCRYEGLLSDPIPQQKAAAERIAQELLDLARQVNSRSGAEVLLGNFILPGEFDPGNYRVKTAGSDWTFRKLVNLELGLSAPAFVHVCDLEFLSCRFGLRLAFDDRAWFESKQLCAPDLLVGVAREVCGMIRNLTAAPKKVLVLDLDNTLWGGVLGDDGLEGIEIGDTSPRGEAFKALQQYALALSRRGVLLAVCSKNDDGRAREAFEKHPEMLLRLPDVAVFKANWDPKPENIRGIATQLNLALDSFVFVDDNPAEIDIVRQFLPQVTGICLSGDPAEFVRTLKDSRLFEPRTLTEEDGLRTAQYRAEGGRSELLSTVTDLDSFLRSLGMKAQIREFFPADVPRIAQLINKSNQFNLTTRRRTEAEVTGVMTDPSFRAFSVRLGDRFGDYGLISVIVLEKCGDVMAIDTWVMSCRVLNRQVENLVLDEIVRLAILNGCRSISGAYLPTSKNSLVKDHYRKLGFASLADAGGAEKYIMSCDSYRAKPIHIGVVRRAYE